MRTIDADAMKAEVESLDAESNKRIYQCAMEDMLEFFVELIDKQPTIEAEPVRHAEWDCIDDDGGVYRCSACGETWYLEAGTPKENNMNYCPTCDAKMDGGERRCQK